MPTFANKESGASVREKINEAIVAIESVDNDALQAVADIEQQITDVAAIDSEVVTVSGISSDVTTVSTNISDIQTLSSDLNGSNSDISTVAASIANVESVANNLSDVVTVSTNISAVNTAADNITAIQTAPQSAADAEDSQGYAEEWAISPEDTPVSVDAGGDGTNDFSALHHAAKSSASASAASTSESNAFTSEQNAATSENNALTSEQNASQSESKAASSASAASTSESNAATSESNAASSASAAATSEANAQTAESGAVSAKDDAVAAKNATENIFDTFDDRFLGSFDTAPTTDNDGNAIVAGAVYYDTTEQAVFFYNGNDWDAPAAQAETSATNALASENAAAASESNAADSETAAANSANAAASSETNAQTAATDAETALDNFTDQYLGAKSSEPSTDNDGDPLSTGALYYNTTGGQLYVWDGSVWQDAAFSAQGTVISFNGRDGAVTLQASDVTGALGYTPQDQSAAYGSTDFDTDFSGKSTDDLSEGTSNLYYTDARADARVNSGISTHESAANPHSQYAQSSSLAAVATTGSYGDLANTADSIGADELKVATSGTSGQALLSDGDGTFSWGQAGKTDAEIRGLFSAAGDLSYDSATGEFSITATERALVQTPVNESPSDTATGTTLTPTLEASTYRSLYGVPMASAQWQISEVSDFSTTIVDETVSGTSTTYTPSSNLSTLTNYYWRVRYTDENGDASDFSEATEFTTADIFTDQPTVTSPADNATDIGETPTITSSAFNTVNGSDTHESSQWVITRVSDSVEVFDSGEDTSNLESIDVPAGVLDEGQESYTVKVRHKGATYGFSAYSPEISFTTASVFFDPEDPANIGSAYAGGYLVGIIDTVAGTIDSQDDYQTGERYALVVSPKSLEDATNPPWDSQDRTGQAGSFTRWDGLSSTENILAKNDTSYEAFEHIRSIRSSDPVPSDGGSDWYLPAMDELELIYRNLKPVTADNYTGNNTYTFPGSQDIGFNPSSDPTASAYTAGDPSQTSVTDFQDGGAEAVDLERYWSSTDADEGGRAWFQLFTDSGFEGYQLANLKDDTFASVRPVRRVVL